MFTLRKTASADLKLFEVSRCQDQASNNPALPCTYTILVHEVVHINRLNRHASVLQPYLQVSRVQTVVLIILKDTNYLLTEKT